MVRRRSRWILKAAGTTTAVAQPSAPVASAARSPVAPTRRPATANEKPSDSDTAWTEPRTGLGFVRLPGGEFTYGCEATDTECYDDEKPWPILFSDRILARSHGSARESLCSLRRCRGLHPA